MRRYRLVGPPYVVLLAAGRDRIHDGRRFVELPCERADRLVTAGQQTSAASTVAAGDPAAAAVL